MFQLHIRRLLLADGWILYNDTMTPITVHGGDLKFGLDAGGTLDHPSYLGTLDWQTLQFTSKRYAPLPVGLVAKFTLRRDGFTLEQGILTAGHSHLDAQAEMKSFTDPAWNFRYRGWVELMDIRDTLREPMVPTGHVDVRGEGQYVGGQYKGSGSYAGEKIVLPYDVFHAGGLISRGSYRIDDRGLEVPDFFAGAFGGKVTGRVTMRFDGLKFRADTHVQDASLAAVLPAIEHLRLPDRRVALGCADQRRHGRNLERTIPALRNCSQNSLGESGETSGAAPTGKRGVEVQLSLRSQHSGDRIG